MNASFGTLLKWCGIASAGLAGLSGFGALIMVGVGPAILLFAVALLGVVLYATGQAIERGPDS